MVGGQSPLSNNFYIEGIDNNNRAVPGPLLTVPAEATTEFVAYQNQFPPEWGHTLGGQFNLVVRTGTNQLHGTLYEYLQNRNLNAVDQQFADQGIRDLPRYDQNRVGGNVGSRSSITSCSSSGDAEYIPLGFSGYLGSPVYIPPPPGYQQLGTLAGVSRTNLGVLQTYAGTATAKAGSRR